MSYMELNTHLHSINLISITGATLETYLDVHVLVFNHLSINALIFMV